MQAIPLTRIYLLCTPKEAGYVRISRIMLILLSLTRPANNSITEFEVRTKE
jgi:hypothetical protein